MLKVKSRTQVIDRFWGTLRSHLKNSSRIPGIQLLARMVRAAQFIYWNRSSNMWRTTSRMLHGLFQTS